MITLQQPISNYQLSAVGVGAIATGLADIKQCINFILRTIPGSDPTRPFFGCNIFNYIDAPDTIAIPNGKKEIFEAIEIWEPRVKVVSITHETSLGVIKYVITFLNLLDDSIDSLDWTFTGAGNTSATGVILTAAIPIKISGARYHLSFKVNGISAFPSPPSVGFETGISMVSWLNANWQNYGRWYLSGTNLVVYLTPNITSAILSVLQTISIIITTTIPLLAIDEFYNVELIVDGDSAVPIFPTETINTLEQLISWVQTNWGIYGAFTIENDAAIIGEGDFSSDFSDDFDTAGVTINRYLIFQTDKYSSASLTFIS